MNSNKNRKPIYLSALDAARMIGVTPETVRSYVKRGVLDGRTTTVSCQVLLASIEQMAASDLTSLEQKQQALMRMKQETEDYRKELEATRRRVDSYARAMEKRYAVDDVMMNIMRNRVQLSEILHALIDIMDGCKEHHRAAEVMRRVIAGQDYDYIARQAGVGRERVRQLFFRGCRYLRQLSSYNELLEENKRLRAEADEHVAREVLLNADIERMRTFIESGRMEEAMKSLSATDSEKMASMICAGFLSTPIECRDLRLSKRTINILKHMDVKSVYDLVLLTPEKISDVRNAGRKTITEIEDMLELYHLSLDMSNTDIMQWLLVEQAERSVLREGNGKEEPR